MDSQLVDYIKKSHQQKLNRETVIKNLTTAGWSKNIVDEAVKKIYSPEDIEVPKPSIHPPSFSMWDSFEHILMFINLYIVAITMSLVTHIIIDHHYPVPTDNYSMSVVFSYFSRSLLNYYMAGLIVSYPIFAVLFLQIKKRTLKNPQLKNLRSRKILVYLTLIITFIILLLQLVSLVFNFINGNTSVNFFLHLITTVTISGFIFGYYYLQIKQDRQL